MEDPNGYWPSLGQIFDAGKQMLKKAADNIVSTVVVAATIVALGIYYIINNPQKLAAAASGGTAGVIGNQVSKQSNNVSKATDTVKKIATNSSGNNLINQTREQLVKSKESYERLIEEHVTKLNKFIKNPDAFDNKGILKNASSPEIRQKIIDGRALNRQKLINKQHAELNKIIELLK